MEVKPEPEPAGAGSACRGCGARAGPGCRELAHEYSWLGVREVYADMLRETFQIQLSQAKSALFSCYICDACIVRLRDASSFKRQVLSTEQRFTDLLREHEDKLAEETDPITVKQERQELEEEDSVWAEDLLEFEDHDLVDSESTKVEDIKQEPEPSSSGVFKPVGKKLEKMLKERTSKDFNPTFMTSVAKAMATKHLKSVGGKLINKTISRAPGNTLTASKHPLPAARNSLSTSRNLLSTSRNLLSTSRNPLSSSRNSLSTSRNSLSTSRNPLSTSRNPLSAPRDPLNTSRALMSSKNLLNTSTLQRNPLIASKNVLATRNPLITSKNPLTTSRNLLTASSNKLSSSRLLGTASASRIPGNSLKPSALSSKLLSTKSKVDLARKVLMPKPKDGKSMLNVKSLSTLLKVMMQKKAKVTVDLTAGEKLRRATTAAVRREYARKFESLGVDKRTERQIIKQNVVNVLKNTTVLPFVYYRGNFKCFYCAESFFNFDMLRAHTGETHNNLEKETRKIYAFKDILYVDITTLKCRKCENDFSDLDTIKEHLISAHKIRIDAKHKDDMVPFIIRGNQFTCHICNEEFHVFRNLSLHIGTHFANYMCEVCGKPFISAKRCQAHENTHKTGHFPCNKCDKVFTSINSRNAHCMEHRGTKYRCPQCNEPFDKYLDRTLHMSQVHNFTRKFVCPRPECAREFIHKPQLNAHVRNHMVKEKKVECLECGMRFHNNHALRRHMVSHTGERAFQCKECGKKYGRSNTLREHMRIHNNDRRHVCAECGQGFVQKCSLKGHMKSRHPHVEWPTT